MALIALAADKGSPGVTTCAVALAAVWPRRALYAECDPHGGDLVYRMPAEHGGPLDPNRGLVSLAVEARRGFDAAVLPQHTQRLNGGLEIMVGLGNADQANGMAGLWAPLGRALDRYADLPYGADVIADCGRVGPDSPTVELLAQSALVLLIARTRAEDIAHVRDRANSLSARLHATQGSPVSLARPPIGVVLIAPPGQARQAAKQVGDLLSATTAGAEVLGVIALDESGADALSGRGRGRVDKAMLTRSARELAGIVTQRYGLIRAPQEPPTGAQPTTRAQPAPSIPPAQYQPQPPQPQAAPLPPRRHYRPSAPIAPTAVHPAGTGEIPAMPPNLVSVPHPGAQPPNQNPNQEQNPNQGQNPNQAPGPNPYTQYPQPPSVRGTVA